MGSGSDFTAFQDFAGIPCINVGFGGDEDGPVYHYHSNYDSFYWMQNFGDPGFVYHRTMAQVLGLIVAHLSELPVLSFSSVDYAKALNGYVKKVEAQLDAALSVSAAEVDVSVLSDDEVVEIRSSTRSSSIAIASNSVPAEAFKVSLQRLYTAVAALMEKASELDSRAQSLAERLREHVPWWKWPTKLLLWFRIRKVNTQYKYIERAFLYADGLDGRPWFKHVVFAPGLWTGYAGGEFEPFPLPVTTYNGEIEPLTPPLFQLFSLVLWRASMLLTGRTPRDGWISSKARSRQQLKGCNEHSKKVSVYLGKTKTKI